MAEGVGSPRIARSVVLTQEHRGHGVSTAAYYLGRMFVAQGLRVLLVDLTGRQTRLTTLVSHHPVKNLVLWTPPLPRPQDIRPALERARVATAGRADMLLLDIDMPLLERAGGFRLDLDYVLAVTSPTLAGQNTADRIAERLHDELPPHGRMGIIFSRVDGPTAGELPQQTEHRHLPVLGWYPADYPLASGDAYSLKGSEPAFPHDSYLHALMRLAQRLIQLVPLQRVSSAVGIDARTAATPEENGHPLH